MSPVAVDENRSAIRRAFASRFAVDEEDLLVPVTLHRLDGVEKTYNGYFTPADPELTQDGPPCVEGNPPPWALAE